MIIRSEAILSISKAESINKRNFFLDNFRKNVLDLHKLIDLHVFYLHKLIDLKKFKQILNQEIKFYFIFLDLKFV